MGDRSVHGEKFLNSASSLTSVNAGDYLFSKFDRYFDEMG
jgi:hypothetical protein